MAAPDFKEKTDGEVTILDNETWEVRFVQFADPDKLAEVSTAGSRISVASNLSYADTVNSFSWACAWVGNNPLRDELDEAPPTLAKA